MAITGFLLVLFVIAHLLGNLQVFLGPEAINNYAKKLRAMPWLLWSARVGLIAVALLHIWMAVLLTVENRRARAQAYELKNPIQASYAARTIVMSGLIILAFVIYHLLHFTFLTIDSSYQSFTTLDGHRNVYQMIVTGFSNAWIAGFYLISMGLLCLHLSHGLASMFQSVGLRNPGWDPFLRRFARITAILIFLGYATIPIAVQTGFLKLKPS